MTSFLQTKRVLALVACMAALPASDALAHATLDQPTATIGTSYKAVVRIGHGC